MTSNFDYKPAIDTAATQTANNIVNAQDFFADNKRYIHMVLSHKKADRLETEMRRGHYVTSIYGLERSKTIYNHDNVTAKDNFESLPQEIQLLRLRQLNQAIDTALNNSQTPIHIKCHALEKSFKNFHRQNDSQQKTREFTRAAEQLTELEEDISTQKIIKFAMGL